MKTDFKKSLEVYKARQGRFEVVDVPPLNYLMIDGSGDPNTATAYSDAIAALYPIAYSLKFASKKDLGEDYVVMPLEALWWASDMDSFTTKRNKADWSWTLMIMVPDWIDEDMFHAAVAAVVSKGRGAGVDGVRLETLREGLCVQTLHIGSYDDEAAVLSELHDHYIPDNGMRMTGKHHEVYLSDARRVQPSKLRTILRQPVVRN